MTGETLKVGGASGYWGDAAMATQQLLDAGVDVIVYDYLAEITMAILARARAKDSSAGYATDFVTAAMAPNLAQIAAQGVRVVSNAGGVNPQACATALRTEIARQRLDLRVGVVTGDDLMGDLDRLAAAAPPEMFSGAPFPTVEKIRSANAYLGAFPIAAALEAGADIVITGRCVDSAVTLGAAIRHFGWAREDLDRLAGGALAGHILECGAQATGGNFTDWRDVTDISNIGYPIADIRRDGSFEVSKPAGTGGLVSRGSVAEQMLYEIADPQAYLLPDVACDFSGVEIVESGDGRVTVSGAKGSGIPTQYKACLTYHDGWRGGHHFFFYGLDAEAKARVFAEGALARARAVLRAANAPDFSEVSVEIIGSEAQFGELRTSGPAREVAAKIAVRHPQASGVGVLLKEATGLGLAAPPGLSGFAGTRPRPSPVLALHSVLVDKSDVKIVMEASDGAIPFENVAPDLPVTPPPRPEAPPVPTGPVTRRALVDLAWARSGDKGDSVNVGVIARDPGHLPALWHALNENHIARVFAHFTPARIERYLLPGTGALNIVLSGVLGGGGTSSLRNDPQGKGYAQLLLAAEIDVVLEGATA